MARNAAETLIGAIVLVAAGGFLAFAAKTTQLSLDEGGYELEAAFRKADGLSAGSDVRVAGVKVGTVSGLHLDPQTYRAIATISISDDIELPEDSDAMIASDGLLGGAFVSITPGASDLMLADGEEIEYTQGSVNILDLVGKAISGSTE